jgi:hypothetical protein
MMEAELEYSVVEVARHKGGLIIYFNDGKRALFAASLLHSILTSATTIDQSAEVSDDPLS